MITRTPRSANSFATSISSLVDGHLNNSHYLICSLDLKAAVDK